MKKKLKIKDFAANKAEKQVWNHDWEGVVELRRKGNEWAGQGGDFRDKEDC